VLDKNIIIMTNEPSGPLMKHDAPCHFKVTLWQN